MRRERTRGIRMKAINEKANERANENVNENANESANEKANERVNERTNETANDFIDTFLDGNEIIRDAVKRFCAETKKENLYAILEAIRQRMHQDGHFIIPVIWDEEDETRFTFQVIEIDDQVWLAAFTSQEEFRKGPSSSVISNFIDAFMKGCLETNAAGIIIDPWEEEHFMLARELIEMILAADGDTEYAVPDDEITAELLEDGSFLKRATEICNRNRTQLNLIKVARILRDSFVWIPGNTILGDADQSNMERMVEKAESGEGPESLVGQVFTTVDEVRFIPDILQNGDDLFFPVFTSEEEMGEYGDGFSKVEKHFLDAISWAKHNDVVGIVIDAFSEPFIVSAEMLDVIAEMDSSVGEEAEGSETRKFSVGLPASS